MVSAELTKDVEAIESGLRKGNRRLAKQLAKKIRFWLKAEKDTWTDHYLGELLETENPEEEKKLAKKALQQRYLFGIQK